MKNKKGNIVAEGITIVVTLFVLIIISIIGYNAFSDVNDDIQASSDMSNTSKTFIDEQHTRYPALWDGIFIFLLVGFWIATLIFAFLIDTHPIFFVISIILIIFILAISAYLTNTYEDFVGDEFGTEANNFPMANFVMMHLLETILVITISIVIALFAKDQI